MKKTVDELAEEIFESLKPKINEWKSADHVQGIHWGVQQAIQSCLETLAKADGEFEPFSVLSGAIYTTAIDIRALQQSQAKLLLAEQKAAAAMESVAILNKEILSNCDKIDELEQKIAELVKVNQRSSGTGSAKMKINKEDILDIIDDWKWFWMSQYQHSEQDYKNYMQRAFGVDANMKYHLAEQITAFVNGHKPKDAIKKRTEEIVSKFGRRF